MFFNENSPKYIIYYTGENWELEVGRQPLFFMFEITVVHPDGEKAFSSKLYCCGMYESHDFLYI